MNSQIFQTLKNLPNLLFATQCVLHEHELLICGDRAERDCYSYHTIKNEHKFVLKLVDNNNKDDNQVTLLSFGGRNKHTLMMKYVNNHNHPIIIGRNENHNYEGMRAVIGGINNNLLFITYFRKNISVFDLNKFQFIKHDYLPANNYIEYHCLVSNSENGQVQEMMKTNKQNYQMLLFYKKTGLSIEYDEDNNTFQFHQLPVCKNIATLLFNREKKWITFKNVLPVPLYHCSGILNKDNNYIYIIGGYTSRDCISTNMKIKLSELIYHIQLKNEIKFAIQHWIRILKIGLGWIDDFNKIIIKYVKISLSNYIFLNYCHSYLISGVDVDFDNAHLFDTIQKNNFKKLVLICNEKNVYLKYLAIYFDI
ncbi:hypothetical protein RFI_31295 [Reticulomyxa filosa]|uniref:Uncharacterized protein n=1 Tax=Reticulomyxa filosa TaxID=46433 RepID=X6LY69_RETFI|nr:hypothetical protein RFI_31295 [Reticulomyxa filosa]|eukprot:ETO06102.1 hypothetical protein RFI_31295 [Reticulomyxa filosa]